MPLRIRALLSNYPKSIVDALDNCGIKTNEDLLCSASSLPELWLRLPPDSMTFAQLEEIREIAITSLSASGSSAMDVLEKTDVQEDESEWWLRLQSTCPKLVDILNATQTGIIEVSGDKGSGKTALLLNVAIACLDASPDNMVHWIDTTGGFSAERASRILNFDLYSQETQPLSGSPFLFLRKAQTEYTRCKLQATAPILDRLNVSLAFTPAEAHDVLESIRVQTSTSQEKPSDPVRLVVIDSATPLFALHINSGSSEGQAMMTSFMRSLQDLTTELGAIALISNNASPSLPNNTASCFEATKLKPALGATMTFLTDATIWLAPARNLFTSVSKSGVNDDSPSDSDAIVELLRAEEDLDSMYIAEVLRSRFYTGPAWWSFRLNGDGVLGEIKH